MPSSHELGWVGDWGGLDCGEDFSDDVALEAAHDFGLGLAFGEPASHVRLNVSLLISKGASVKAVQSMLRHKTATETLNTYAHLWPEDNALVRRAVDAELSPIVGLETTDPTADISRTSGSAEG